MSASNAIVARMGLDLAPFRQGLEKTVREAQKTGAEIHRALVEGAAAVGAGATIGEIIEWADKIADLGQRYGVSTTMLQEWGAVAEQNGSSIDGLAAGLNKLIINADKALAGDEDLRKSFAELGVTVEDLQKGDYPEMMRQIGASSMHAADMVAVFGKSALELVPTLQAVADGSAELGTALDDSSIQTLAQVSDAMKSAGQDIKVYLGGALVWVIDRAKEAGVLIAAFMNIAKGVAPADAWKIAGSDLMAIEDARNQAPEPPKPKDLEDRGAEKIQEKADKLREKANQEEIDRINDERRERIKSLEDEKKIEDDMRKEAEKKEREKIKRLGDAEQEKIEDLENAHDAAFRAHETLRQSVQVGLHELATEGKGDVRRKAREAEKLEAKARKAALRGDMKAAEGFMDRSNRIKRGIGSLRDDQKGPDVAFADALEKAQVLKNIEKNTAQLGKNL